MILSLLASVLLASPARAANACEAHLLDAKLEKILRRQGFDDALLKQTAIFRGELRPFGRGMEDARPVVVVHAPGREPSVYEILADTFLDAIDPYRLAAGAKITVNDRDVLGPAQFGKWQWHSGVDRWQRIGPGQRDPGLARFVERYRSSLERLFRSARLDARAALESEVIEVHDARDPRTILRLPLRDGETDERFRSMWVFRPESAEPILMENEMNDHVPYDQKYVIDAGTYIFKESRADGLEGRAGLVRVGSAPARVAVALGVAPIAIEALLMQPTPVDLDRLARGRAVAMAPPDTEGIELLVYFDHGGEVITVGAGSSDWWHWPRLSEYLRRHRILESPVRGPSVEVRGEGKPTFTYRVFDGLAEYHALVDAVQEPLGAEWFERRDIPLARPK